MKKSTQAIRLYPDKKTSILKYFTGRIISEHNNIKLYHSIHNKEDTDILAVRESKDKTKKLKNQTTILTNNREIKKATILDRFEWTNKYKVHIFIIEFNNDGNIVICKGDIDTSFEFDSESVDIYIKNLNDKNHIQANKIKHSDKWSFDVIDCKEKYIDTYPPYVKRGFCKNSEIITFSSPSEIKKITIE